MRIVAALGGNALLERGESPEADIQEAHVVSAVKALTPLLGHDELVITHGNGPQVGVLALESARDPALSHPYPFDVLGAQTQGMIGYWLAQALSNGVPGRQAACLLCRTVVRADDPALANPTKFVGPVYDETTARQFAADRGWDIRQDGQAWRRVVPSAGSPKPPVIPPPSGASTMPPGCSTAPPARSSRPHSRTGLTKSFRWMRSVRVRLPPPGGAATADATSRPKARPRPREMAWDGGSRPEGPAL